MHKCFLELQRDLEELRTESSGRSLRDVFLDDSPEPLRKAIDLFVKRSQQQCAPCLGYVLPSLLASRATVPGLDDFAESLIRYCQNRLGEWTLTVPFLYEVLVNLFPSPELLVRIERNLALLSNGVVLDKDGLLVGPKEELKFCKEGVLVGTDWYLYDGVPGAFVTGSFADDLVRVYNALGATAATLGMKVNPHVVIDRQAHFDSFTKAYIRGPIGISADVLNKSNFPQDPSGTVTEHKRIQASPLMDLFPLDRIEVMWSRRQDYKSVQIESLIPEPQESQGEVAVPYVHSRWSTQRSRIVHFDGATKIYDRNGYGLRLATDIRKVAHKPQKYTKLFRLDTELDVKVWSTLTAKFFDPNELIVEYFGGYDPAET